VVVVVVANMPLQTILTIIIIVVIIITIIIIRNVMSTQSITHHPNTIIILKECEQLYQHIKSMDTSTPLQDEERLFIEAMRDLAQSNRNNNDDDDKLSFDGISKLLATGSSFKRTTSLASTSSNDTSNTGNTGHTNTSNKRKVNDDDNNDDDINKVRKSIKCT